MRGSLEPRLYPSVFYVYSYQGFKGYLSFKENFHIFEELTNKSSKNIEIFVTKGTYFFAIKNYPKNIDSFTQINDLIIV